MSIDQSAGFDLVSESALDSDALDLLFREGRTANTFTDEPVSEDTARAIYELAKMGPTMMNIQPLRVTWVRSDDARERLVSHMAEGNAAKTKSAPLVAVLSFDTEWPDHFGTVFPIAPQLGEGFAGEDNKPVRETLGNENAWLQAGYFILAVRAMGLHAGPMSGFDAAGVDADLHVGLNRQSFMVVNIGKPGPDAWFPRLPRLDAEVATTTL
ncbi:malonic semialdehyde reductase [Aeromicrobium massiliense]|uniref:malonic semialdehyde reductase n=1 Tax=Aeromicrobium massiliense TaxID=1464554 RepID=UPI00031E42DC|nr:malonic semialdehyde reductase [Aeromicrobium massiliense]